MLTRRKESAMSSLLREVLGDVLRQARINQGRTLRQVSDTARVSLGYLSEVERGRKEASSELLSAICDALDVPLSRLLTEASEQLAGVDTAPEPTNAGSPTAANIDASTKVVIPPVVALALSASA
jgi:transcriptional regulator with XRE-family HTH domain